MGSMLLLLCNNICHGVRGEFIVPESPIVIPDYSYTDCLNWTSVIIPDTITTIGSHCFENCRNVLTIWFGDSVFTLGDFVFFGCPKLTNVSYGKRLHTIGTYCGIHNPTVVDVSRSDYFINTDGSLYNNDTKLLIGVDRSLNGAEEIHLPLDVQKLQLQTMDSLSCHRFYVHSQVVNLNYISIPHAGHYFVESGNLYYETNLENTMIFKKGTKTVAYGYSWYLTTLNFDSHDWKFGAYAFGSSNLTQVTFDSRISDLSYGMFCNCLALKSLVLPNTASIPIRFADGCTSLTTVNIPSTTISILSAAFRYCQKLERLVIPTSVETIEEDTFYGLPAIIEVQIGGNFELGPFKELYQKSPDTLIWTPSSISADFEVRSSCTTIRGSGIICIKSQSIRIKSPNINIMSSGIKECGSLRKVIFDSSEVSISNSPVVNCRNLELVSVPCNVTKSHYQLMPNIRIKARCDPTSRFTQMKKKQHKKAVLLTLTAECFIGFN